MKLIMPIALAGAMLVTACSKVGFTSQEEQKVKETCLRLGIKTDKCILKAHDQIAEVKSNRDVDVLFVVDNSGSMAEEQVNIGNKISGFMDKIKDLNWQIALTTTDAAVNTPAADGTARAWGDGQFRPFDSDTGTQFILNYAALTASEAQTKLAAAIQVGIKGSGTERAINATYRSVARSISAGPNADFFRTGARLAVVAISDEDECSTGAAGCPAANAEQSIPQNLITLIRNRFGVDKVFTFNSIIYIPNDTTCTTGYYQGAVYKTLTTLTGGLLGSVCSADFTAPLAALGNRVVDLVKSVALDCAPEDLDGDGTPDLRIQLADGSEPTTGFQVSGNTVTFTTALPEGSHRFFYLCD